MSKFLSILKGDDLRSIGKVNEVVGMINSQEDFDELFAGLGSTDRNVRMRTADAIEKITLYHFSFLKKHRIELLKLFQTAQHIELKWHLALIITRIDLNHLEFVQIWDTLTKWATDNKESKIVRVNSIQGLYDLLKHKPELSNDFNLIISKIGNENIPSMNARIRKMKSASH